MSARDNAATPTTVSPPASIDSVDPSWLTEALRAELGPGGRVVGAELQRIGEGRGHLGEVYRIVLRLDGADRRAPDSVVVKLPPQESGPRDNLERTGGHLREIDFLSRWAAISKVRSPKCYAAGAASAAVDYVLVLEDASSSSQFDQLSGLPVEAAETALRELAGLHGSWWDSPRLPEVSTVGYDDPQRLANGRWMITEGWGRLCEDRGLGRDAAHFGAAVADALSATYDHLLDLPATLLHGDPRADNLQFDAGAARAPVILLDWQNVSVGPVAVDLCYFLVQNLTTEDFATHHRQLLGTYAAALSQGSGVVLDVDHLVGELAWAMAPNVVAASSLYAMEPPDSDRTRELAGAMATRILSAARILGVLETLEAGR